MIKKQVKRTKNKINLKEKRAMIRQTLKKIENQEKLKIKLANK